MADTDTPCYLYIHCKENVSCIGNDIPALRQIKGADYVTIQIQVVDLPFLIISNSSGMVGNVGIQLNIQVELLLH